MVTVSPCPPLAALLDSQDLRLLALAPNDPRLQVPVPGLSYDSRTLRPGDIFFAYAGRASDGHAFIPKAIERGAALVVAARAISGAQATPTVVHPDPKGLMGRLARALHQNPAQDMDLVAITGTNGKTTTAHLLAHILAARDGQAALLGTLGATLVHDGAQGARVDPYETGPGLTTPEAADTLAQLRAWRDLGVRACVMEASSIALCEGRLAPLPASVSVLTNISHDHLDYHGTMQAYRAAKAMLFRAGTQASGTRVLPWALAQDGDFDGPGAKITYAAREQPPERSSGGPFEHPRADIEVWPDPHVNRPQALVARTPRGTLKVHSALFGRFNQENMAAAIAVAIALDVPDASIVRGLAAMTAVPGRLQQVLPSAVANERAVPPRTPHLAPWVFVDFAHTPDALQRVLDAVRPLRSGRLHLVVGCGGDRDPAKRPVMAAVGAKADRLWITSDNPRSEDPQAIAQAMVAGLTAIPGAADRCTVQLDRAQAIASAVAEAGPQDVVLIAGKGHEPYQLVAGIKWPFDDRVCAQRALDAWPQKGTAP